MQIPSFLMQKSSFLIHNSSFCVWFWWKIHHFRAPPARGARRVQVLRGGVRHGPTRGDAQEVQWGKVWHDAIEVPAPGGHVEEQLDPNQGQIVSILFLYMSPGVGAGLWGAWREGRARRQLSSRYHAQSCASRRSHILSFPGQRWSLPIHHF